jgi:hypothetical protein
MTVRNKSISLKHNGLEWGGYRNIAFTVTATDYKGFRGFETNAVLIKRSKQNIENNNNKQE